MDLSLWKYLKKEQHLTFDALAEKSNIPKRTLEDIFAGRTTDPRTTTVEAIERALGVDKIKKDPAIQDEVEIDDMYAIPILGQVVAGKPIEEQENLEGYIYVNYRPKEEYFAVRVHGNSMKNCGIIDNSIVIVHKQETAENGEIVVAMLNCEQTIKRFKRVNNEVILLVPENPDFEPLVVTKQDELIILGKIVEFRVSL